MATPINQNNPSDQSGDFAIRFPTTEETLDQHEEWFDCTVDGQRQRMRVHDYATLFSVPGLYEALVYEQLACNSPSVLRELFAVVLDNSDESPSDLRVIDLGAGNGIVAEEISKLGVEHVVGLDLLPEARLAAERDRPGVYDDYLVTDLCDLPDESRRQLDAHQLNCLVTVAALGFGDIPPKAFAEAFNSLSQEGWLGMTIKEDFIDADDDSGFAQLINRMIDDDIIQPVAKRRYCHRKSITGESIYYIALVAEKLEHIPEKMFASGSAGDNQAA